jgi:putative phosphoesterase
LKVAILSDIHSNIFALEAVLQAAEKESVNGIILLGDQFGYYPWASETYDLLQKQHIHAAIKGNHDKMVLEESVSDDSIKGIAVKNRQALEQHNPSAIDWLRDLPYESRTKIDGRDIWMCHGSPDDPVESRFYPDDDKEYPWFSEVPDILFLGHTHYYVQRDLPGGSKIVNPGSVGQPRDGNPNPQWGVWNSDTNSFETRRTNYNRQKVIELLIKMNWNKRAIFALDKTKPGTLQTDVSDQE